MTKSNVSESPLESVAGATEPHVTDAFKLLSDEIRLAILLALWEVYDPHAENNAVSFSQLFDRISIHDSGNFSYHLDKLLGHYVEETDDGYRLRNSGLKIVRAVIAGSGLETRRLPPNNQCSKRRTIAGHRSDERLVNAKIAVSGRHVSEAAST